MNPRLRQQTVGRTICLLFVSCLVASEVSAVTEDDLDELKTFVDATPMLVGSEEEKLIDTELTTKDNALPTKPRFINSTSEEPLGMDSLTIIWYLTTFTALLGFFVVMACTEKSCNRGRDSKPPEDQTCPPTPCPSYKNFAPPSYDTVMKKYKNQRVFIVPVHDGGSGIFNPISSAEIAQHQVTMTTAASVDIEKGLDETVR